MYALRAAVRLGLMLLVVSLLGLSLLLTSWIPWQRQGVHHAALQASAACRLLLRIMGLRVKWDQAQRFRTHHGFIFPNHVSFVDIFVMLSVAPVRFLAKAEIRTWPVVGYIAQALGVVFVQREDRASRSAARTALAVEAHYPAIVLFPEGGTGAPDRLHPFRYGAFEIAVAGSFPILPCIIIYSEPFVVFWGEESIWAAAWRMLSQRQPLTAQVTPLHTINPLPDDDPQQLAIQTHGAMEALRASRSDGRNVIEPGL